MTKTRSLRLTAALGFLTAVVAGLAVAQQPLTSSSGHLVPATYLLLGRSASNPVPYSAGALGQGLYFNSALGDAALYQSVSQAGSVRSSTVPAYAVVSLVAASNVAASGNQSVDGVTTSAGNRVLLTAQSSTLDDGIWVAAAGAWARSTDAIVPGMVVSATNGSAYANKSWILRDGAVSLGSSSQSWSCLNCVSSVAVGAGLTLSGSTVSLTTPVTRVLGGTNSTTALSNNRLMCSSSGKIDEMTAGTSGQVLYGVTGALPSWLAAGTSRQYLRSNGTAAPSWSSGVWTSGSGVPSDGNGNDDDFYYDYTSGDLYFHVSGGFFLVSNINGVARTTLTTSNATQTTVYTGTYTDNTTQRVDLTVTGHSSSASLTWHAEVSVRNSGSLSILETLNVTQAGTLAGSVAVSASGLSLVVKVTGIAATTINWTAKAET